jgi:hypothetical protein
VPRSRQSAKQAGTRFESSIAEYLRQHLDDRIERRRLSGANDRGDLSGIRVLGQRVVAELKDYGGRMLPGPWINEVEVERGNDDAGFGVVIVKRRGTTKPGEQFVLMTVDDWVASVTGERPSA